MERVQRSLSLGLQTILIRGLGTVPGPVVFGFVMDSTCLLWRQQEVTYLILSHLRIYLAQKCFLYSTRVETSATAAEMAMGGQAPA